MLFTDSDITDAGALQQLDSEVVSVAATSKPSIILDGPGSICEQAWSECQQKLLAAMQSYSGSAGSPGMANHNLAVLSTGLPARTQPRVRLNQIVASDNTYGVSQSPLQTWMLYCALAIFYRDASSRMGKDRYQEKYDRYQKEAVARWSAFRSAGLPILFQPLECPGAKHAFSAGAWNLSNISAIAGSGTIAPTVQVAITYYDGSQYISQVVKGNAESGPSALLTLPVAVSKVLHVDISSLRPPTGISDPVGFSQGITTPLNATHWNLWVGVNGGPLYLQNASGIPIATKTYTLAADPLQSGYTVGAGQYATLNQVWMNVVNRA